jgi:mRNA-degrading endonuclease RelE of RelBE toxin-antitoxin system
MKMFILKPSHLFLEQIDKLSDKAKRIIEEKLVLLKANPFRFKRIKGYGLFLFRIRFEDCRKEKRVIYLVDKPYVKILCILDRDNDYKMLRAFLRRHGIQKLS